jgi:hypothetical protein
MKAEDIPEILRPLADMLLHKLIEIKPSGAEQINDIYRSVVAWAMDLPVPIRFRQLGAEFVTDKPQLLASRFSRELVEPCAKLHLISLP